MAGFTIKKSECRNTPTFSFHFKLMTMTKLTKNPTPQNAEEFKGTKGEWFTKKLSPGRHEVSVIRPTGAEDTICETNFHEQEWAAKEAEANAKLIAQSPALLKHLKDFVAWANIKDGSPSQHMRDAALLTIKKATS